MNINSMHNSVIRKYDIRGIIGEDLQISDGYGIGRKFGSTVFNACIGYDSRIHSPDIEKELIKGLRASGANVIRIGLCSSPMLYTATKSVSADIGIMITASHNPSNYNGFKFFNSTKAFSDVEIREVMEKPIQENNNLGSITSINIYNHYIRILKNATKSNSTKKLSIAWDCSNSPVGSIIKHAEKFLPGHTHIIINHDIDGMFPMHDPDPMDKKNLVQLINVVRENKCDIGIALDGDGDRVCFIDNKCNIVSNDHLFMIIASKILEERPGSKVIVNTKISMRTHDFIEKLGGHIITCATGHSLIKKKMIEENAEFAGELSGHFFFSELGFDDGLYSAIKAINIILNKNLSLFEIVTNLPKLHITDEIKITVKDKNKFHIIESIKEILKSKNIKFSDLDGIKVMEKHNKWWWLLRASNTQNCLTARCEGKTSEDFERVKETMFTYIEQIRLLDSD